MDMPIDADPVEISPAAFAKGDLPQPADDADARGPSARFWLVALALVIVFGYLSGSRRASLGTFVEQVGDVIKDFRGYDPEF